MAPSLHHLAQLTALLVLVLATAAAEPAADPRTTGRTALAAGDWSAAREALEQAAARVPDDPGIWADLGLAYRELDEPGRAILAWERTLALQPWHWEVRAELDALRDRRGLPEPGLAYLRLWAGWLPEWVWTVAAVVAFWWLACRIALPRRATGRRQPWLALLVLLVAGSGCLFWILESRRGVVLVTETPLKVAPTAESPATGALDPGRTGRITDRFGDHVAVVLEDGQRGWLSTDRFVAIRDSRADADGSLEP